MFGYSTKDKDTLNPFLFAEQDRLDSLEAIKTQIQNKVGSYNNKTFETLIQSEINYTPATIDTICKSLEEQICYGDIDIINPKTNKKVRSYKNIKLDYIIKDNKQKRFNF